MDNKETYKMNDIEKDDEFIEDNNSLKAKFMFDLFIGAMPTFIDLLIEDMKNLKLKKNQEFDITIDFNEYINIIESKINILRFYFSKLDYNINIIVKSQYPKTEVIFFKVSKNIIEYLQDVKFLIFCEYNKNLGHA